MSGTYRRNYGSGHAYYLDGHKVQGVTTILSQGLPKPALVTWAAKTTAAMAVDHWDELGELAPSERLAKLTGAPSADRDAAAVRGTRVHTLAEKLSHGEEITIPEDLRGHVESCVAFLDEWQVKPLLTEPAVFSRKHWYAGSFDLIADLADGQRWLLDYKTNRSGPFGEVAFQLAAYRYAEFHLGEDGEELPVPEVDACGVVWLRADGYDLYPFDAGPEIFREFLYIQQTAQAAQRCRDYKAPALTRG